LPGVIIFSIFLYNAVSIIHRPTIFLLNAARVPTSPVLLALMQIGVVIWFI